MVHDYLKANANKIGIDRDIASYDINIQVMSLMQERMPMIWVLPSILELSLPFWGGP